MERFEADSVAAIIASPDGRYLVQRRDDRDDVDFRGAWGFFGGAIDPGEEPADAMRRELLEELSFDPPTLEPFATLIFDERPYGGWYCRRRYFETTMAAADVGSYKLAEGSGMGLFDSLAFASLGANAIAYDVCAMIMYERREESLRSLRRHRLSQGPA